MTGTAKPRLQDFIPNQLFGLTGRNALVVGVGGLGVVAAEALAAAGAGLAVADFEAERAEAVAHRIVAGGGRAQAYRVDVTDKPSVTGLFERVIAERGRIHVVVVAAGITLRGTPEDFAEADWDRIMAVNLKGTFLCCQGAGRHMLAQGGGSIINFSSIAGGAAIKSTPAYTASKGGVNQLTKALALEWADRGVRVNAVAPSYFETEMVRLEGNPALQRLFEDRLRRVPMGRMGQPSELAGAVLFLASPAASMVTGVILPVDGGFLAA